MAIREQKPPYTKRKKKFWQVLGPGLITGASDDDPSGIATYSQAGAGFGFSTLWMALLTFPLMAAIQGMCARIGLVTKVGLTSILRKHYPRLILYLVLLLSFPAIILNVGADIEGMGAVAHLLFPKLSVGVYSIGFTILLMFVIIRYPYQKIVVILKWLCLSLFLYMIVPFMEKQDWGTILKKTFIPSIQFNKKFFSIFVAILGTTISPYLFFWQATMSAEEVAHNKLFVRVNKTILTDMRTDVNFGMLFSNLVMFFIILTTGTVLYKAGIREIDTVEQAAKALEPLTGKLAYLFFAIGIIGTGLLSIPVFIGSLSYMIAETFGWKQGLDKKFKEAKGFYLIVIFSLVAGVLLNFIGVSPIKALIYTAILYGLTSPVLIGIILHICNNKKIMGKHTNKIWSNVLGTISLVLMLFAAVMLIYFFVKS